MIMLAAALIIICMACSTKEGRAAARQNMKWARVLWFPSALIWGFLILAAVTG